MYHIEDASNVCFTLVVGEQDTLLWDTGMGLYDVAECVAPYVRGKLHVVLSHGHYDHACGLHYFKEVFVHPDDIPLCRRSVGKASRERVLRNAKACGCLDDSFDAYQYMNTTTKPIKPLTKLKLDLGGLEVQFRQTPGHTIGSLIAYIPRHKLLLTGDMWNPHTWLFFPESQPLAVYTQSMQSMRDILAEHVLCPHDPALRTMERLRRYIDGLNEQTFAAAQPHPVPPYTRIHTFLCHPEPDSILIFNGDKRT